MTGGAATDTQIGMSGSDQTGGMTEVYDCGSVKETENSKEKDAEAGADLLNVKDAAGDCSMIASQQKWMTYSSNRFTVAVRD